MSETRTSSQQFAREARIGLTIVAVLFTLLVYVAVKRLSGGFDSKPTHYVSLEDQRMAVQPEVTDRNETPGSVSKEKTLPPAMANKSSNVSELPNPLAQQDQLKTNQQIPLTNQQFPPKINNLVSDDQSFDSQPRTDEIPQQPPIVVESGQNLLANDQPGPKNLLPIQAKKNAEENRDQSNRPNQSRFAKMKAPENANANSGSVELVGDSSPANSIGQFEPGNIVTPKSSAGNKSLLVGPGFPVPEKQLMPNNLRQPQQTERSLPTPADSQFQLPKPDELDMSSTANKISKPNVEHSSSQKQKSVQAKDLEKKKLDHKPQSLNSKPITPPCKYRVTEKETSFWTIAAEAYGDGQWFRALHLHNKKTQNVEKLLPGTQIDIPTRQWLKKHYPNAVPATESKTSTSKMSTQKKMYTTQQGETLFSIATEQLGQASRYTDILKLNRDVLPNNANHLTRLQPGIRLILPIR